MRIKNKIRIYVCNCPIFYFGRRTSLSCPTDDNRHKPLFDRKYASTARFDRCSRGDGLLDVNSNIRLYRLTIRGFSTGPVSVRCEPSFTHYFKLRTVRTFGLISNKQINSQVIRNDFRFRCKQPVYRMSHTRCRIVGTKNGFHLSKRLINSGGKARNSAIRTYTTRPLTARGPRTKRRRPG